MQNKIMELFQKGETSLANGQFELSVSEFREGTDLLLKYVESESLAAEDIGRLASRVTYTGSIFFNVLSYEQALWFYRRLYSLIDPLLEALRNEEMVLPPIVLADFMRCINRIARLTTDPQEKVAAAQTALRMARDSCQGVYFEYNEADSLGLFVEGLYESGDEDEARRFEDAFNPLSDMAPPRLREGVMARKKGIAYSIENSARFHEALKEATRFFRKAYRRFLQEKTRSAESLFREGIKRLAAAQADNQDPFARFHVSHAYCSAGSMLLGRSTHGPKLIQDGLDFLGESNRELLPDWELLDIASWISYLAELISDRTFDSKIEYANEAIDISEYLLTTYMAESVYTILFSSYAVLAHALVMQGHPDESRMQLERMESILEHVPERQAEGFDEFRQRIQIAIEEKCWEGYPMFGINKDSAWE